MRAKFSPVTKCFFITLCFTLLTNLPRNLTTSAHAQDIKKPLRVGVAAMISPKETIGVYQEILYYLESKLKRPVEMVQRKTYAEMDNLLKTRDVDFAFICSGPYVTDHEDFGVELLAAPQAYGKSGYYSYILAHKDSAIETLEDLRGKTFAFTDPISNTGCVVPTYMLAKMNEKPETFFGAIKYSGHHSKSVEMVAEKKVDGAAVDHLVWEYANRTSPAYTQATKIVAKSQMFGIPPIVVHPDVDPQLKEQVRNIFLNMHKDPYGKKILSKIFIDKFVLMKDSDYDSIREMKKWIEKNK